MKTSFFAVSIFNLILLSACASGGKPEATDPAPITNSDTVSSGSSVNGDNLTWRKANLTTFTSYPDPGSEECIKYNGCAYSGEFAFVDGKQDESWVMSHNIAAIHSKDANTYKLKKLRLRQGSKQIDVTVYDMCADSDCNGCCTQNSSETGFLIDLEKYTSQKFGVGDGVVEWACLDCN